MKIAIIFQSGVGNTKNVALKIGQILKKSHQVEIYSVEELFEYIEYENYDALIIGFPTIHTHPTKRILDYLEQVHLTKSIPVFVFTTCGLYSANTLRIFCKECIPKKLIPVHTASYRCAATDGVLLAPYLSFFKKAEKNLEQKIDKDIKVFTHLLEQGMLKARVPRFKIYSIFNYPNKWVGHHITFPIYLHQEYCNKCGKCIRECPAQAYHVSEEGYPHIDLSKCEKCYRCIHHCSEKALSLSKKKRPQYTMNHSNQKMT